MSLPNQPSNTPSPAPGADPQPAAAGSEGGRKRRPRWKRVLTVIGVTFLGMALLGGIALGGAEYYTARPEFCRSCHVMEPYFLSWSRDVHGAKLHVRCVDCHYAPGERHTFEAKFKGLSQAASYFSGRYGASRPRAHFNEASCLTSSCHGDGSYKNKVLLLGEARTETRMVDGKETTVERVPSVHFTHAKHEATPERVAESEKARDDALARLRGDVAGAALERIQAVAVSVKPAAERFAELDTVCTELKLADTVRDDARTYMDAEHLVVRRKHLAGLGCAACHSFDPSGKRHVEVNRNTCFTCHFNLERFNQNTGTCLKCHDAPTRAIVIHAESTDDADAKPTLMDHRDIVARNVECASCHFDVVTPSLRVTTRECEACHDQAQYLEGFDKRTTTDVERYHAVHIGARRARCEDCHRGNEHRLVDPRRVEPGASFLAPVLNDCQHCHPKHHEEQVDLLAGIGGAGVDRAVPNAMFGSRINCRGCHTESASDLKGDKLIKATATACLACHSADYAQLFEQWNAELENYLAEVEALLATADKRAQELEAAGRPLTRDSLAMLEQARQNVHLVKAGQGIHNRHFALQLLDVARRRLTSLVGDSATP